MFAEGIYGFSINGRGGGGPAFIKIIDERGGVGIRPKGVSGFSIQAINSLRTSAFPAIMSHCEETVLSD
jgi:hypothetical protein